MIINSQIIFVMLFFSTIGYSQTERWIYRYSPGEASAICYGADGNLYVAGVTYSDSTGDDFTVISLSNSGLERWVYKYNGLANYGDNASAIVYGNDGNIYAVGASYDGDTIRRLTVISLTPNGTERWVYQFCRPTVIDGFARSVIFGADGNIYVVGAVKKINTYFDIIVISLTESGAERWFYTYTGPGSYGDYGYSIAYGVDGYIYLTGYRTYYSEAIVAICLTNSGSERWVYQCDKWSTAQQIVYGLDGNLYIFGTTYYFVGNLVFSHGLLISLSTSGNEHWRYENSPDPYDPSWYETGVYGADGNLYAVGVYGWDIPFFLVESVSDSGTYRWKYIDTTWGYAMAIAYGNDNNIYTGGVTSNTWQGGNSYFTIVGFDNAGLQRWIHKKHWYGEYLDNKVLSIVYGLDGNIYAAGITRDSITGFNFTVISLSSGPGVNEANKIDKPACMELTITPSVVCQKAQLHIHMLTQQNIDLKVYDITGREILTEAIGNITAGKHIYNLDITNLSSGVYFVKLKGENEERTKKILVVK